MAYRELTSAEKERARILGQRLRDKMAEYFPRETTDEEVAEIHALRKEIEALDLIVSWSAKMDPLTSEIDVKVTLYYKPIPAKIIPLKKTEEKKEPS